MSSNTEPAVYHLRLLGPIRIERNGHPIGRLESRKALALLCFLCCQVKPITRSELCALFWGDLSESRGRGNLSRVLHNISTEMPGCLIADRHTVCFRHHDQFWVDIVNFERLSGSKKHHLMAAATELYRGEFLESLSVKECPDFEMWLTAEREQWQQRMAQLFQTVIDHHTQRGEYEPGLRFAERLLSLTPWSEEAHRQKMLLHYLSGQRTAALAQFEQCRHTLDTELGVEPSQETWALRRQIEEVNASLTASIRVIAQPEPLLERGDEHTWLVQRWESARRSQGKFTLVEGEAGVGKTVLIEDILAYAASQGARVLRSRCYEYRSGLTYEAFVNALRPLFDSQQNIIDKIHLADSWLVELSRLWPEVSYRLPATPLFPDEETTARHRLFEAIAQLLLATLVHERALILFLDDLHEADQPTLDLLRYLYHRLYLKPIWFVAAYQREETTPNHPLTLFRNVLVREGHLAMLTLKALSSDTVFQILRRYDGLSAFQIRRLGRFLHEQSEGNPFILDQVRLALHEAAVLNESEGSWQLDDLKLTTLLKQGIEVPAGVAAVMENRLARLNPRARRLLQVAAAIGRQFDLSLLLAVSGEPPEWVEICLTSWIARGLVVEIAPSCEGPQELANNTSLNMKPAHCYNFSHLMLWRVVLNELTPLQHVRLDDRIAEVRTTGAVPSTNGYAVDRRVEELGD